MMEFCQSGLEYDAKIIIHFCFGYFVLCFCVVSDVSVMAEGR